VVLPVSAALATLAKPVARARRATDLMEDMMICFFFEIESDASIVEWSQTLKKRIGTSVT
jgi:hypothetical protein